jgi:hypothetical protein
LAVGTLAPTAAHAAAGTSLYVNNASGSGCSDSGSGAQAVPFCTVQAGVNAAVAGDTVLVETGSYDSASPVTISKSGTSSAPITITSVSRQQASLMTTKGNVAPLVLSGASYVDVTGFMVESSGQAVTVENSSHVTVDSLLVYSGTGTTTATSPAAIEVTGTSSNVTVSRNELSPEYASAGILVDSGSSSDTITTNYIGNFGSGIIVKGGTATVVTSNTVYGVCNQGILLSGASTGSTIENNAVASIEDHGINSDCPTTTSPEVGIGVDSTATSGTTLDYNIDYPTFSTIAYYDWAGTAYSAATDLNAATGQAAHDLNTDPGALWFAPTAGSNAINSANSDAPGELSTDMLGNARTNDPNVPDTGAGTYTYYDRGAVQYEDPLMPTVTMSTQVGTAPATISATESVGTAGWASVTQWSVDFGDGSTPTTTSTPTTVKHTYTTPGTYTVSVTATDGYGATGRGSTTNTAIVRILSSAVFHPVTPARILDTRNGTGTNGVVAAVKPNSALVLKVDGAGPVPASGAVAVTLNLTVTNPTGSGNISAYADGSTRPASSNENFTAGQTVANQVTAQVGGDGKIDLYNSGTGTVDLIADVAGYYGPGAGLGLQPEGSPSRILDTRNGTGTGGVKIPVPAKGTLKLTAANTGGGLDASTTTVLNVTVTNAKAGGFLSVYPDGTTRPGTSSLNFGSGQTVANQVVVQAGGDGTIDFYNNAGATVDVIADLLGVFSTSDGLGYVPISPQRLLDTRHGIGAAQAAVGAFGTVQVTMDGVDGLPKNLQAVAANVTVTTPTAGGDIEAYPDYQNTPPGVSTLNFTKGATVANSTTMTAAYTGLKLYNQSSGSSQLIVDVFGYYQLQ